MRVWLSVVTFVVLVTALAAAAHAQGDPRERDDGFIGRDRHVLEIDDCPPPPQVSAEQLIKIGSEHFERGEVLYVQGDYKGAVKELVAAYCIKPFYTILKDIGQAYERELDYERAIAYLERYVMEMPNHAQRAGPCAADPQDDKKNVTARIKVLQGLHAKIRINTEPGDAQITLSNEVGVQNRGVSGQELEVTGGRYDVLIERKGFNTVVETVRAEIGKPYTLFVRLEPKKGTLRVRVVPANARIFLDQRQVGLGAFEAELEGRRYTLTVEAPGFVTTTREVEVIADRPTPVSVELAPVPQTGRRQFIGYSTIAGGVVGGTLAAASDDPAAIFAGTTIGLGAGFFGSYFATPRDIPLGTSSLAITSSLVGGTLTGAATVLFSGDMNQVAPAIGGGMVLGGLAGYYVGSRARVTPGDAAVINSGALWGTVVGTLFWGSFEVSDARRIGAGLVLSGLGMGTIGAVLMTRYFEVSRTRVALIDLGGIVGVFVGAAIDNVVSQAESSSADTETTANYTLGGLAAGLVIAGILSRSVDNPRLSVAPVLSQTQASGTTSSTMTLGVGGQF